MRCSVFSSSSIKLFTFFLWTVAASVPALAQSTDLTLGVDGLNGDTPVEITSDELVLDQQNGSVIFSGNVVVRQGAFVIMSGMVRVKSEVDSSTGEERITSIHMSERVTFANEGETAEADRAVYTPGNGLLIMIGNVLVEQGITVISADTLEYNLENGTRTAGGEVKTILRLNEN